MAFEIVSHTADVRLAIRAGSLRDLFREAVRGLYAVMAPAGRTAGRGDLLTIEIDAVDHTAALVDFLNQLLYRAHVDGVVAEEIDFPEIGVDRVVAKITSRRADGFGEDVKAVTYHEARIVEDETGQFSTTLVLDI